MCDNSEEPGPLREALDEGVALEVTPQGFLEPKKPMSDVEPVPFMIFKCTFNISHS